MIGRNAVQDLPDAPILQWANGRVEARRSGSKDRFATHVGWHIEVGKWNDLDEIAAGASVPLIDIRHQRDGGKAEVVVHWNLGEHIRFYPLTSGPVARTMAASMAPAQRAATIAAGLGIRWGRDPGERSKLAVRGYLQFRAAPDQPWTLAPGLVQLSVRSRMTDALLAALVDHVRVCEVADTLIDRVKHPDVVTLYELALPLGPGDEEQWGKGETATVTPLRSMHPNIVDLPYLRSIWRPDPVAHAAESDWPGVQAWAATYVVAAADELGPSNGDSGAQSAESVARLGSEQ